MKRIIATILLMAGLPGAFAQGTFQFTATLNGQNEVPPNNSTMSGSGYFDLTGNTFNYGISFSAPAGEITNVAIHGPAGPGFTAPIVFDLGAASPVINPPPGIFSGVSGTINNLTSAQIDDLFAGLWYVNVYTASGNFPDGEIRGQIMLVPEPSTYALVVLGGGLFVRFRRKKSTGYKPQTSTASNSL
jgi:hypothetical protein